MNGEIDRRRVLALLVAAGVATLAPAASGATDPLQWLAEGVDADGLSELALQAASHRTSQAVPVAALLQDDSVPAEELAARLREMVKADFTHGRTVNLAGWQVSQTEAYLYGMLAQTRG